jgi:hypothetical protein
VVLKLNKLTWPKISFTKVVSATTTNKIIEDANKRWRAKLLPDKVKIYSRPNPLAPKTHEDRRNSFPHTTGIVLIRINRDRWLKNFYTEKPAPKTIAGSSPTKKAVFARPLFKPSP